MYHLVRLEGAEHMVHHVIHNVPVTQLVVRAGVWTQQYQPAQITVNSPFRIDIGITLIEHLNNGIADKVE